ncbi:EAL domain-containing protein [Salinisphaera sp. Q1T1-3]|uniref:EAL domain-containing protein n=1 Tax=Salinisphaera sp. Q1T1-3 TaxID=2321229 RepID=UPI000E74A034|nr:EAL domain-containing protein [Salinisphaera sp. Q1T1-3]RJS91039.1 EAL domain-containing protein [Salinisphaera sp. Q1T1-3]
MSECARKDGSCRRCEAPLDFDFTMAFQPIVDLAARRVVGYEALVRGVNGESAASILNQVDKKRLYRFDQQCRTQALRLAHRLGLEGRLSINFLPNAVYDPQACIQSTLEAAAEVGWSVQRICFEITESEDVTDKAHLQEIVNAYRDYGFVVALDDFGTGFANLDLLVDLQPDLLKIDRRFVTDIDRDPRRQAIVTGMLGMARDMRIDTIAEGIETAGEAQWLFAAGITRHQGYFYARPGLESLPVCTPSQFEEARGDSG